MLQILEPYHLPPRHAQDQHIVFLADLACPNISEYFKASNIKQHFRSPFRWILIASVADDTSQGGVPGAIDDIEVLPDAEVMVAQPTSNTSYDLYFIYKIGNGKPWCTEPFGVWDTQAGFQQTNQLASTADRRLNLNGYEIPVCYVLTDNDSVYHLTDGINDHIDTITKVNFRTTNHLLDFLNATRKYVFANTWGYKVNGTWNGLTGYLIRNEVEIGGSPMFFTSERISEVDYISSPTPTRSKFVFQQPKLSYENNLFLLSFKTTVWYSLLGLIFLMFLALLAVAIWEWKRTKNDLQRASDAGVLRGNVQDVALLIYGAACQQGSTVELKGSLGRVVMLVLFLALMFLYTSYSANIVALLQSSSSQIRSLEDLLHSRLRFGVHDTVFNRYYFSTATEPTRKAIYQTKVAPPGTTPRFMTMEEGVKNMQKGLFAFHMETGVGYKFVGKFFHEGEKCGLKEIQYLQVIDPWQAVRKNTPYKELFKIGMKRVQEHGLQKRENHLLYEKRPKCSGRESNFVSEVRKWRSFV
ncbi:ionotropic receptor 75a-like [Pectinophora gossypiella]|uniref:ionotropic receptor 75a-like n=1 Tax=Pectinophora gossypiella TaxID=13191 RepID=UPI00214F2073|nr:ionotropic receptor 75a-like [Pectinophora gossypiella]